MRWTPSWLKPPEWRPWFAWHPVVVKDEWVWLEWVERCKVGGRLDEHWIYQPLSVKTRFARAIAAVEELERR